MVTVVTAEDRQMRIGREGSRGVGSAEAVSAARATAGNRMDGQMRISHSFTPGEIQVLAFMMTTLLRGGTPSMATRHKDFPSLYRKVLEMQRRSKSSEEENGK